MNSSRQNRHGLTSVSRRKFIALSGMAAGSLALPGCSVPRRKLTASDKLNVICVGAAGKGSSDDDERLVNLNTSSGSSDRTSR